MITVKPTTEPIWVIAISGESNIPAVVNVGSEFSTGLTNVEEFTTREGFLTRLDVLGIEYGDGDYVAEEIVLVPNWDSFNAYMLTDATFKGYRDAVRVVDGDLNSALFNSYSMVATNGVGAFSLVWGAWVAISAISSVDKEAIAVVAEGFNLPGDFVAVVRG